MGYLVAGQIHCWLYCVAVAAVCSYDHTKTTVTNLLGESDTMLGKLVRCN